jgi:hypothetical protein
MRRAIAFVLLLVGCGPNVAVEDEDSGADATGSVDTSDSSSVTNVTNPTTDPTSATSPTTVSTDPTTDTSVDTSTTEVDTGNLFFTGPDGGGGCGSCNIWLQDCFLGTKCVPWNCDIDPMWLGVGCRDVVDDPVSTGDTCTAIDSPYSGLDDCDANAMCWNVDADTLVGVCAGLCDGSKGAATCDDPDRTCFVGLDGILPVCVLPCDPLASGCADDEECVHNVDNDAIPGFACVIDEVVGAFTYGEDCTDGLLCDTGLVCRGAQHVPDCPGGRCCTTLGRLSDPPACPDISQTCLPLYPAPPDGVDADLCYCGVAA